MPNAGYNIDVGDKATHLDQKRAPVDFSFAVDGVRQDNGQEPLQECYEGRRVHLRREPDSADGKHPIAVGTTGGLLHTFRKLGYVPVDEAEYLAPLIDGGWKPLAEVQQVVDRKGVLGLFKKCALKIQGKVRPPG